MGSNNDFGLGGMRANAGSLPRFLHKVERLSPSSLPKFKAGADLMQDVKLIWLWEKWKQSVADEIACETERAADRAHMRTRALEQEIAETRAEGLLGIGVQFGLWRLINGRVIVASEQADAAYEALVRLTGKDYAAEARAIFNRQDAVT
jgi:hypothetical protein